MRYRRNMTEVGSSRADTRVRIVDVAARLLSDEGPAAVTTRGVADAAGVQAPTIYRLFGDKDGLLEAVAEHTMATYVSAKADAVTAASAADVDPLDDLRVGWEMQIDFGMANPAIFRLLSEPHRVLSSPALRAGVQVLQSRIHRLATTGRLRVSEPRAVGLIQAAGTGVVQTLLSTPLELRDAGLAAAMFDAILQQILIDGPETVDAGPVATAVALRAITHELDTLTDAERRMLTEWLDRAIGAH